MGTAVGRARRKECQETSDRCSGAKVGRAAAQAVGQRRSLRTAAQSICCRECRGVEEDFSAAELNRRVQVTVANSQALFQSYGSEVDYQAAAPAETRTPNWHRAKSAHKRVRMEGWRQRRLGSQAKTK